MSHNFPLDASFFKLLMLIDTELAKEQKPQGCPYCGGPLHRADYPRSPFGIPAEYRDFFTQRISYCCSDCRKRVTPTSVRFFGRCWYPAPLFLILNLFRHGVNSQRLRQIQRYLNITITRNTLKRWRRWWQNIFPLTLFWQKFKGRFLCDTDKIYFPLALLKSFTGNLLEKLFLLLQFLAPMTAGHLHAVQRR